MKIENNKGFTLVEILIVTLVVILIAASAFIVFTRSKDDSRNLKQNEAYFQYLNNKVADFDAELKSKTGDLLSYDQQNKCEYMYSTDFSNGPLGCYIDRAYYFPASNESEALSLDRTIVSIFHTTFPSPRYRYPLEDFTYAKNVHDFAGIVYVGQPQAGFNDNSGQPSLLVTDTGTAIGNAACSFQISWPNENKYVGSNSGYPIRDNWSLLEMIFSCGANASKHYF